MKNKYELFNLETNETIFKTFSPYKMLLYIVNNLSPSKSEKHNVIISKDDYIVSVISTFTYVVIIQDILEDLDHRKKL